MIKLSEMKYKTCSFKLSVEPQISLSNLAKQDLKKLIAVLEVEESISFVKK